jgi:hypothetical protein
MAFLKNLIDVTKAGFALVKGAVGNLAEVIDRDEPFKYGPPPLMMSNDILNAFGGTGAGFHLPASQKTTGTIENIPETLHEDCTIPFTDTHGTVHALTVGACSAEAAERFRLRINFNTTTGVKKPVFLFEDFEKQRSYLHQGDIEIPVIRTSAKADPGRLP